jgi:high-affinity iron transporter
VIVAGVLVYGLGDLQDAGLLSGQHWIGFDLTAHVDPGSWWASIVAGVTELSPKMTVLQVVAWAAYLAVVIPAFMNAGRSPAPRTPETAPQPSAPEHATIPPVLGPVGRWGRLVSERLRPVAAALLAVSVLAAGTAIAALPSADAASSSERASTTTVTGSGSMIIAGRTTALGNVASACIRTECLLIF